MSAIAAVPELDRQTILGGSDVGAVLGVSPWKTPYQLYLEKTGQHVEDITPERAAIFKRGHRLEPFVREWAREDYDLQIVCSNKRYTHPKLPFLSCEIDFEWLEADGSAQPADVKTSDPRNAKAWGEPGTDEIPAYYTAQFLFGQGVIEAATGIAPSQTLCMALIGMGDLRPYRVYRHEALIRHIFEKCEAFWERVQTRRPPTMTTLADVELTFKRDDGTQLRATGEMVDMCERLALLKKAICGEEARCELLERDIKSFMGPAQELLDFKGRKIASWKVQERKAFTVAASSSRTFRTYQP